MFTRNLYYKYILYDRQKGKYETFNTKEELIKRLARANVSFNYLDLHYFLIDSKTGNSILDNLDYSGSDLNADGSAKRYILLDGYNRVIDARMYIDDIKRYDEMCRKRRHRFSYGYSMFTKNHCVFRVSPVPGTGVRHWGYYRRPRLLRSIKQASMKEYEPYIRKGATIDKADAWWDEFPKSLCKSWKHQGKRKRQWDKSNRYKKGVYVVKAKTYKDTYKNKQRNYDEWEEYEWK